MKLDLLTEFRKIAASDDDIHHILSAYCGNGDREGTSQNGNRCFTYLTGHTQRPFCRIEVSTVGSIFKITRLDGLRQDTEVQSLIIAAKVEMTPQAEFRVVERLVFSQRPVKGYFRWKDKLKIEPIGSGVPILDGRISTSRNFDVSADREIGPPFPFSLSIKVQKYKNGFIETNRSLKALDRYQALLCVLLNYDVQGPDEGNPEQWALDFNNPEEPKNRLVNLGFVSQNQNSEEEFSSNSSLALPVYEGQDYYQGLFSLNDQVHAPNTLSRDLESVSLLTPKLADKLHRASYWFSLGVKFQHIEALSILAFVAAMECLFPTSESSTSTEETGGSKTTMFKNLIDQHSSLSEAKKGRANRIYDLRSELVHGSFSSRVDRDAFSLVDDRMLNSMIVKSTARSCILGWLRNEPPS